MSFFGLTFLGPQNSFTHREKEIKLETPAKSNDEKQSQPVHGWRTRDLNALTTLPAIKNQPLRPSTSRPEVPSNKHEASRVILAAQSTASRPAGDQAHGSGSEKQNFNTTNGNGSRRVNAPFLPTSEHRHVRFPRVPAYVGPAIVPICVFFACTGNGQRWSIRRLISSKCIARSTCVLCTRRKTNSTRLLLLRKSEQLPVDRLAR